MLCVATCQQYHSSCQRDHIANHTATTRGHTGNTLVPVKTGQCHPKGHCSHTHSRSSFCKPLQNASNCFNLLQNALQEIAIFCIEMQRNASFCFVHTCASPNGHTSRRWARPFSVILRCFA